MFVKTFIVILTNHQAMLLNTFIYVYQGISGRQCEKLGQDASKWNSAKIHDDRLALEQILNNITSHIFSSSYNPAESLDFRVNLFNDLKDVLTLYLDLKFGIQPDRLKAYVTLSFIYLHDLYKRKTLVHKHKKIP